MSRDNRAVTEQAASIAGYYAQLDAFERELLQRALDDARGNVAAAALALGLN